MKKIGYIKPEIKEGVIIMESAINAASPFSFNDENGTGEGGVNDGDATGDALGNKNGSFWDDEN